MIIEKWIGKHVEGSVPRLYWGSILAFGGGGTEKNHKIPHPVKPVLGLSTHDAYFNICEAQFYREGIIMHL
jgi:hypothetical protein